MNGENLIRSVDEMAAQELAAQLRVVMGPFPNFLIFACNERGGFSLLVAKDKEASLRALQAQTLKSLRENPLLAEWFRATLKMLEGK